MSFNMSKRATADHDQELEQPHPHAAQQHTIPATSTPSSVQTYLQLQSLPDVALVTVAPLTSNVPLSPSAIVVLHLKPLDLIKGLQVVDRWALATFAEETKELVIWTDCVVKEDPPPEMPSPSSAAALAPPATGEGGEGCDSHETGAKQRYAEWVHKHAAVLCSLFSRFPRLGT